MADPKTQDPSPIAEISHGPSAFETFLDENQKKLITLGVIIALGMAAWVVKEGMREGAYRAAGIDLSAANDIASLEEVVKSHADTPSAASAAVLLSDAQWEQGQQDASLATLKAEIAANPEHPATAPARARLAARLHQQGKIDEAKAAFQDLLDQPTASYFAPYALISLGHIAKAEGNPEKAEELYTRASEGYPDNRLANNVGRANQLVNFEMPEEVDPPEPSAEESGVDQTPFDPTALQGGQSNPLFPGGGITVDPPIEAPTPPPVAPPAPVTPPAEAAPAEAPAEETTGEPSAEEPAEDGSNE